MVAGRDTVRSTSIAHYFLLKSLQTATTLAFVVYLLAMHPEVTKRLRAEVIEKVGSTRTPTYDDIREMKYLRAVINGTITLYPWTVTCL